jgi:TMEM175 potassium channel family protein
MVKNEDSEQYMPTKRLETLVDGIFAIAMTLLVLGLAVPHINEPLSNTVVQNSFYSLLPNIFSFVLSFILLALFWNRHHRIFSKIKMINSTLIWINVIWLLFIVLVPFSSSALGQYGNYTLPNVIFNLNMLGIAIFLSLNRFYASRKNLMQEESKTQIKYSRISSVGFISIALLALLLSYLLPNPSYSTTLYTLLIPLQFTIRRLNH